MNHSIDLNMHYKGTMNYVYMSMHLKKDSVYGC